MSLKNLHDNHDEMIGLLDKIAQKNKEFLFGISRFDNLRSYYKKVKALKTDEDRARFLCILTKKEFLTKIGALKSYAVKIDKTIHSESNKDKIWDIKIQFNSHKKQIEVLASYSNWDTVNVKYKFDLFSLCDNELLNEETDGETKCILYEGGTPTLRREDKDIRIIIDCLFKHLLQKNLDKSNN